MRAALVWSSLIPITEAPPPIAVDQGAATLLAALIAAVASTLTSLVTLIPKYYEWRRARKLRHELKELLSGPESIRSLEWLARRLGTGEREIAAMLRDVDAHGVRMAGGVEGAALDARHRGG
jgi:hypothetical protein